MSNGFGMFWRGFGRGFGSFMAAAATLVGLATAVLVLPEAADATAGLQLISPAVDPSKPVADRLQFAVIGPRPR